MKRFPGTLTTVVGFGLLVTACVPIDGNIEETAAPSPTAAENTGGQAPVETPGTDLPWQPYSTDGLKDRTSKLPPAMVAYQVQQGSHPLDDAVPGSERVLLAEDFSSSGRFALPGDSSSDSLYIEVACSNATKYSLEIYDSIGAMAGSGTAAECSSTQTGILGFSPGGNLQLEQLRLTIDHHTEGHLGLTIYTRQGSE
ncbi:MAG: hypothetical protein Q4P23_10360 [Micrococcaceae bacterium]|nr:hypothetical protein [Micrococcaceae bacterium]